MLRRAIACGILALLLVCATGTLAHASAPSFSPGFRQLHNQLKRYGFTVRLERPPQNRTYGTLHIPTRTIWVNPVVQELGIAEPTLVHEAVHAAQHCASARTSPHTNPRTEKLMTLGLPLETPTYLRPYFMRYSGHRRHLEREAYTVQVRGDRLAYVTQLLKQHCK